MSSQEKTIVRAFVAAINAQDWRALEHVISPNFRRHSAAAGEMNVDSAHDLIQYLRQEFVTFPDAVESIEDIISDDDKVAVRHRFRGTQTGQMGPYPPSHKVMDATYIAIYRIERDRIAEAWVEWDNMSGLRQLGHLPF